MGYGRCFMRGLERKKRFWGKMPIEIWPCGMLHRIDSIEIKQINHNGSQHSTIANGNASLIPERKQELKFNW